MSWVEKYCTWRSKHAKDVKIVWNFVVFMTLFILLLWTTSHGTTNEMLFICTIWLTFTLTPGEKI